MPHRLDSARAKIARGKELAESFKAELDAYYLPMPFQVRQEYDETHGHLVWKLANTKPPSLRLGVLVGEIAHHLRSALDHVVYQLIEENGNKPDWKSGFPIFSDRDEYKKSKGRMVNGVEGKAVDRIDALQPHKMGYRFKESVLWRLQQLNNSDKHRVLTLAVAFTGFAGDGQLEFEPALSVAHGAFVKMMARTPMRDGEELLRIETKQRFARLKGDVPVQIVLEMFPRESVTDLVNHLAGEASLIVQSFNPHFKA